MLALINNDTDTNTTANTTSEKPGPNIDLSSKSIRLDLCPISLTQNQREIYVITSSPI